MNGHVVWAALVAVFFTFVSWRALRDYGSPLRAPRTPHDVYVRGHMLLGPLSWILLVITVVRAVS